MIVPLTALGVTSDGITKCRAQEAAKKQRAKIASGTQVQAIRRQRNPSKTCMARNVQDEWPSPRQTAANAQPTPDMPNVGHYARACKGDKRASNDSLQQTSPGGTTTPQINLSKATSFEPAPTIAVHMSSLNGQATVATGPTRFRSQHLSKPPETPQRSPSDLQCQVFSLRGFDCVAFEEAFDDYVAGRNLLKHHLNEHPL